MAGRKAHLAQMWKTLQEHITLEDPIPSKENVYLGVKQAECKLDDALRVEKAKLFHQITPRTNFWVTLAAHFAEWPSQERETMDFSAV